MRFTIVLFFIALLPVMMLAHWWEFEEKQQPLLLARVEGILKKAGIQDARAELRYLDLAISGHAPDEAAVQTVLREIERIGPMRLRSSRLGIPARLKARLREEDATLEIEGWLPDQGAVDSLLSLLRQTRPDLRLEARKLRTSPLVHMPEGEKLPFHVGSLMLSPILAPLRVPSSLEIARSGDQLVARGLVPDDGLRAGILEALRAGPHGLTVDATALRVSTHALAAPFTEPATLLPLLRSFFSTPSPGSLRFSADDNPVLTAEATRTLESQWLTLLRPLTHGRRAELHLDYYPSLHHFPGRRLHTVLPPAVQQAVTDALADPFVRFSPGKSTLAREEEARLASLVPALLSAGPGLRLIVGGHPDPNGTPEAEARLAMARAEQVVSFLIEQGTPAVEITPLAFDPVPPGGKHAPAVTSSVEILIE
ncbi:MAG: OmpA family protein [Prosthecobacter sp.]|nr:OmpA family protein [Prosthecobacter sp.]